MKRILTLLTLLSICISATAADLPDYLEKMKDDFSGRIKVWAVTDDDMEDENENEFFVLQFESRQDDRDTDLDYEMRVTVQLTDKKTGIIAYAQSISKPGPIPGDDLYADHTAWEFQIPFGEMKKPKMTACVIQFGFNKDTYFIPVAEIYEDVDSVDEIIKGEGTKVQMKRTRCSHYTWSR